MGCLGPRGPRGTAVVDPSIVVSGSSLISSFYGTDRQPGVVMEEREKKTDDDFVVVICITKLMHDFDDNADEIALTGR
jgi:hypothetical protein